MEGHRWSGERDEEREQYSEKFGGKRERGREGEKREGYTNMEGREGGK